MNSLLRVVAVSAPDKTSHNIYIYGGKPEPSIDDALDDVFVLTIPSFHWINIESPTVRRWGHACTLLHNRYIVTYGVSLPGDCGAKGILAFKPIPVARSYVGPSFSGPDNPRVL
jgi:Kelch motif